MRNFILLGSKGGAGRTASSVVLATGLFAIGLRPLHLQLTMPSCPPVIALAKGVPFSTEWLPDQQATPDSIRRCIDKHPECATVVIDMTKHQVTEVAFPDLDAAILLPFRRAPHEIEAAVRDYRALQPWVNTTNDRDQTLHSGQSSVWLLPVSWPVNLGARDFVSILGRFDASMRSRIRSSSIMMPGIPNIPSDDLDDLIDGTGFLCSPMICDAAAAIARAVFKSTRGSSN